ncbi:uncharacterized protein LOC120339543 [Styela clava]|uniref:uncharacterized protein LOC120339543 n=1 Tax=Styela clava TaxID=7725 RepID=UPI00193ADA11|nr:uncharacterized protein LOC120339543 [Styela clava]
MFEEDDWSISGNSTDVDQLERNRIRSTVLQVSLWIYTVIGLYILIALTVYERSAYLKRKHESVSLVLASKGSSKRYGIYLRSVNIAAAVIFLCRTALEHAEILIEVNTTYEHCNQVVQTKFVFSGLFFCAIYLFLWIRQRMCYNNALMSHLTSTLTHFFSWASLAALLAAEILTTGLFFTRKYKRSGLGCDVNSTSIPAYVAWVVYGITTAVFQIIFIGLFIYPLSRQQSLMKFHKLYKDKAHKLMPLIKRSLTACLVCVITNLVVSILVITINEPYNIVPILLYDFNLVVNLLAVISSFSRWKIILAPYTHAAKIASVDDSHGFQTEDRTSSKRHNNAQRQWKLVRMAVERTSSVFTISNNSVSSPEDATEDKSVAKSVGNLFASSSSNITAKGASRSVSCE